MKRIHVAAVAALVLLATPALTGCFSGKGATTNMQATMNSGNGVEAQAGPVHVENATIVLGGEGATAATLEAQAPIARRSSSPPRAAEAKRRDRANSRP